MVFSNIQQPIRGAGLGRDQIENVHQCMTDTRQNNLLRPAVSALQTDWMILGSQADACRETGWLFWDRRVALGFVLFYTPRKKFLRPRGYELASGASDVSFVRRG